MLCHVGLSNEVSYELGMRSCHVGLSCEVSYELLVRACPVGLSGEVSNGLGVRLCHVIGEVLSRWVDWGHMSWGLRCVI